MHDTPLLTHSKRLTKTEMDQLVTHHDSQPQRPLHVIARKLRQAAMSARSLSRIEQKLRDLGLDPESSDIDTHPDGTFKVSAWAPDGISVIRV